MALKVTRCDIWTAELEDRAGGTAEKLEALANAGANLEMVFARRKPDEPGRGIVFAAPLKGAKVLRAAQGAGFSKGISGVRIEGGDKPGLGARITRALADAGISFRGMSAVVVGRKFVDYVACDSAEDAANAVKALKKLR